MDIKKYIRKIDIKLKRIEKKAKNPFLESNFAYNPFRGAIEQTYIWIEKNEKS